MLGARRVTRSKFHIEDLHTLGATEKKKAIATSATGFVHPWHINRTVSWDSVKTGSNMTNGVA